MNFDATLFGFTVQELLIALAWGLGTAVVVRFGLQIVVSQIRRLSQRTETDLDDLAVELLDKTRFLFILLVGVWAGARSLDLPREWDSTLTHVLTAVLLVQAGFWGMGVVNYAVRHYKGARMQDDPGLATAIGALGFIARLALWVVVLLTILSNFGVEITPLMASLGVGGLAVALALQNVLGDLLASLSIVFDKPFVIGDFVIIGEFAGTIESVGLKTTRVRALSGEQVVFANSDMLSSRIRNLGRMKERRVVFHVGVEYDVGSAKLRRVPELIQAAIETRDNVRFDRCHFQNFGDFSLNFETVYFMTVPDYAAYMDTQQAINLAVYESFEEEGIPFAFPTQTLHLVKQGTGSDESARGAD
jgi:small-conductance mechanosensitive channel